MVKSGTGTAVVPIISFPLLEAELLWSAFWITKLSLHRIISMEVPIYFQPSKHFLNGLTYDKTTSDMDRTSYNCCWINWHSFFFKGTRLFFILAGRCLSFKSDQTGCKFRSRKIFLKLIAWLFFSLTFVFFFFFFFAFFSFWWTTLKEFVLYPDGSVKQSEEEKKKQLHAPYIHFVIYR